MAFAASTDHFAGSHFQSSIKRTSAMTYIFKAAALGCPRTQRQKWLDAIQRLDGAFFIHAKNRCLLRGLQIKRDDLLGFGGKMRIVARQVSLLSMRFET